MQNPQTVETERAKPSGNVEQRAYLLKSHQKIPLVKGIFDQLEWDSCIIFTSTKKGTDELQRLLKKEGLKAASIHGDRSQDERNKALAAFKNKQVPIIVATDVLARGIDIKEVSIIINYDVPNNTDDYVHRIGRTARYDKSGIAITFITQRDRRTFADIDKIKDNSIKKLNVPNQFKNPGDFSWENHFQKSNESRKKQENKVEKSEKKGSPPPKRTKREDLPPRPTSGGENNQQSSENGSAQKHKSDQQQNSEQKQISKKPKNQKQSQNQSGRQQKRSSRDSSSNKKQESRNKKQSQPQKKEKSKEKRMDINLPPVIEKAVDRNKRARRPAKGVWGIIKSFIPKIRSN